MDESLVQFLMRHFGVSYGQVSHATGRQISKSTAFRIGSGQLPEATPAQIHHFSMGLATCIQQRIRAGHTFPIHKAAIEAEFKPVQSKLA